MEDGLRAWAKGMYTTEAAVGLLIRTGQAVGLGEPTDDGAMWWIDWSTAIDRAGARSGGERRIVAIACSLGSSEQSVNLSDAMSILR
jgi:hypothetical protein